MLFSRNISLDGGIMEGDVWKSWTCNALQRARKRPFFAVHSTERFNSSGLAGR
jgi:hypothetical protein